MKRTIYRGYVIDTDHFHRPYIYNTASQHAEEDDHILIFIDRQRQLAQAKKIIDDRIETGDDTRHACVVHDKIIVM